MTEDDKSQNKTLPDTSQTQTQSSQSPKSNSTQGVWGSKYLASEEERKQFASNYGSELVITMGNSNLGKE